MAASGIDLEKPSPDQKSVGMRDDSPSGFFCIATNTELSRLQQKAWINLHTDAQPHDSVLVSMTDVSSMTRFVDITIKMMH